MIATVTSDPGAWIFFAAIVGAAIGFFACALFASYNLRKASRSGWREGYAACNRDHDRRRS